MTPFKFTPEDFDPGIGMADDGQQLCTYQWAAKKANAKLDEWLKSAVKVYGSSGDGEPVTWYADYYGLSKSITNTHSALLIGITKLDKKKCEHEPKLWADKDKEAYEAVCFHCGVTLKATWQEI